MLFCPLIPNMLVISLVHLSERLTDILYLLWQSVFSVVSLFFFGRRFLNGFEDCFY